MEDAHLRLLCEQAAHEQNRERLYELVREINCILEEKEARRQALRRGTERPSVQN